MSDCFIRYAGSKSRHSHKVLRYFHGDDSYREPFVGSGSVFLAGNFRDAWLNDLDFGVYDLWKMVKEEPQALVDLIKEHTPIVYHEKKKSRIEKAIELWKTIQNDKKHKHFPAGYRTLFLNKTCFNGVISGGLTGGLSQKGRYSISSRWAPERTIRNIWKAHNKLQMAKVTNLDWSKVVETDGENVAVYLDPPYLEKGKECYELYFSFDEHVSFAEQISKCKHRYVVTVDDCKELRDLWLGCGIKENLIIYESWSYSMTDYRTKNREGRQMFIVDGESFNIHKHKTRFKTKLQELYDETN